MDYAIFPVDEFDALFVDVRDQGHSSCPSSSYSETKYPESCPEAKQHARRVVKELGVADGLIFLPGQAERTHEDSDQSRPFRQRRYFYYLSGANFEDCTVTYEIGRDRLILWIPYVEPREVLWFGTKPSAAECLRRFDVDDVRYSTQLSKFLRNHAASPCPPTTYVLHPNQAPSWAGNNATSPLPHLDYDLLQPAMDRARVIKTGYEIDMIRRANDISSAAHRRVAERVLSLTNERQVDAIFQALCIANGAPSQAYPIIAAAGTNASTLHYGANNGSLRNKQCLVLDAGCEWDCYASDITRTLPLSGSFSPNAAAIHAIVQRMQNECIDLVRPGKLWNEIHLHAARVAANGLMKLRILKGDPERVLRAGTVAAFFPHGLGHHVGLEVHDVTTSLPLATAAEHDYPLAQGKRSIIYPHSLSQLLTAPERKHQRLQKNMVVTVEPGIYFCREYLEGFFRNDPVHAPLIDWDLLESYYEVGGVRIEDCILVTESGYENLTTAPKGDELLDIINKCRQ